MGRKVGIIVMLFFVLLGAAFFVLGVAKGEMNIAFWQVYIGAFAGVYTVFAGTDAWQKNNRSKYYRPEMDDKHPEAQRAAVRKMEKDVER